MRIFGKFLKWAAPVVAGAVLIVGCSKQEAPPPPPPKAVVPPSEPAVPAPPPTMPPPATHPATPPTAVPAPTAIPPVSSAAAAQDVAKLENAYQANPDFASRVENIYKITDLGTPEAIAALGRLFHAEKEVDLKTEILDSLFDIDGQDDKKAALLAAGAGADQPKDVRESAIDGLTDLAPKYALPILRALASDQDEEIRDLAKDAIEQLQQADALQK